MSGINLLGIRNQHFDEEPVCPENKENENSTNEIKKHVVDGLHR